VKVHVEQRSFYKQHAGLRGQADMRLAFCQRQLFLQLRVMPHTSTIPQHSNLLPAFSCSIHIHSGYVQELIRNCSLGLLYEVQSLILPAFHKVFVLIEQR
jgi:hypothetical protein